MSKVVNGMKKIRAARRNLCRAFEILPIKEILEFVCDEVENGEGDLQYLGMDIRELVDDFDWDQHEEDLMYEAEVKKTRKK